MSRNVFAGNTGVNRDENVTPLVYKVSHLTLYSDGEPRRFPNILRNMEVDVGHLSRYHAQHGNPRKGKKAKGPLRLILSIQRHARNLFDTDWVILECGHEGPASPNAKRARCGKCGKIDAAEKNNPS